MYVGSVSLYAPVLRVEVDLDELAEAGAVVVPRGVSFQSFLENVFSYNCTCRLRETSFLVDPIINDIMVPNLQFAVNGSIGNSSHQKRKKELE